MSQVILSIGDGSLLSCRIRCCVFWIVLARVDQSWSEGGAGELVLIVSLHHHPPVLILAYLINLQYHQTHLTPAGESISARVVAACHRLLDLLVITSLESEEC